MVAGCEVTVKDGAYVVVLALREGSTIVEVVPLSAPSAESEADSLAGLRVRVRDALKDHAVLRVALWRYEGTPGGVRMNSARPIVRAEGVVLAAAGEVGIELVEVSPASERGKRKAKNDEVVAELIAGIAGSWRANAGRAVAASTFA
jgi:hypothetical protein